MRFRKRSDVFYQSDWPSEALKSASPDREGPCKVHGTSVKVTQGCWDLGKNEIPAAKCRKYQSDWPSEAAPEAPKTRKWQSRLGGAAMCCWRLGEKPTFGPQGPLRAKSGFLAEAPAPLGRLVEARRPFWGLRGFKSTISRPLRPRNGPLASTGTQSGVLA